MILVLSACDNVEWGGLSMELLPPPPPSGPAVTAEDSVPAAEAERNAEVELPTYPVLYMGTRSGSRVSVHPVGQLVGDSILPLQPAGSVPGFREAFIARDLAPGTALTLFASGVRVGTLRVDAVSVENGWCEPMPVASGVAEMVSGAGSATRFLALAETTGAPAEYDTYRSVDDSYEQRVAGLALASQALARTGAIWPESVLETRADMQAIPLDGDRTGAIAATFMYQDALGTGAPAAASAYSLFVLGQGGPENYTLEYLWYRRASEEGKAAPRFFEQFDWDGDGEAEILLEVFGEGERWEAALDRGPDGWQTIFESRCIG